MTQLIFKEQFCIPNLFDCSDEEEGNALKKKIQQIWNSFRILVTLNVIVVKAPSISTIAPWLIILTTRANVDSNYLCSTAANPGSNMEANFISMLFTQNDFIHMKLNSFIITSRTILLMDDLIVHDLMYIYYVTGAKPSSSKINATLVSWQNIILKMQFTMRWYLRPKFIFHTAKNIDWRVTWWWAEEFFYTADRPWQIYWGYRIT